MTLWQSWLLVAAAILFEVIGTVSMKLSVGFTRLGPSVALFVSYGLAFTFLTLALRRLEVSTIYAVWSGAGTVLVTLIGILLFQETASAQKLFFIALIIIGVVGLKLSGP